MAIVTLNLAEVNQKTDVRPQGCPHCGSSLLQGWGKVRKPLRDPQLDEVEVRRFRCCDCGRTFRHYPQGVGPADQSLRLQQLAAICWVLGLSTRMVTSVLGAFGISLCHMSVWRDVQALAQRALEDPQPEVRETAAVALAQIEGQAGIDLLQDAAAHREGQRPARALWALALILDAAPDRLVMVSRLRRLPIFSRVAQIRLRRKWPRIRSETIGGAAGGALAFASGLELVHVVHMIQLRSSNLSLLVTDIIFFAPILAVFGLLVGAIMAFGISAGEALLREKAKLGGVLGGTLLGGVGSALALSPLAIAEVTGFPEVLLTILGGGLLGGLIALGITLSAAISTRRPVILFGGSLGGSLGVLLWGVMGYKPLAIQSKALSLLIAAGALTGVVITAAILIAEARRKRTADKEKKSEGSDLSFQSPR